MPTPRFSVTRHGKSKPWGDRTSSKRPHRPWAVVTAEQFREIREFTGKSREDVADFLGVSLRTVGHWETGRARVPYAAFRLLRLALRGDILDPAWQGYRIVRGRLVTPEGYAFGPGDLAWLSLLVQRANFASLIALRAVTLRSGGRCAFDSRPGLVAPSEPSAPHIEAGAVLPENSFSGLPSTNRGVSETERLATGVGKPKRRAILAPPVLPSGFRDASPNGRSSRTAREAQSKRGAMRRVATLREPLRAAGSARRGATSDHRASNQRAIDRPLTGGAA